MVVDGSVTSTESARIQTLNAIGDVAIATPYLRRIAQGVGTSSPFFNAKDESRAEPWVPNDAIREIASGKHQLPQPFQRLYRAVLDLLACTEDEPVPTTRKGASPFMSMCLRQVPAVIALEEAEQESLPPESRSDVTSEVYADLEAFGAGVGWRHLREVVRAHGIALLVGAIGDGLVPTDRVIDLVKRMGSFQHASRECELLLNAVTAFQSGSGQISPAARVDLLGNRSLGIRFRLAEQMLHRDDRQTPQDAPSLNGEWSRAVLAVTTSDSGTGFAFNFLQTAWQRAMGGKTRGGTDTNDIRPMSASFISTISNSLIGLASVAIVASQKGKHEDSQHRGIDRCIWLLKWWASDILTQIHTTGFSPSTKAAKRCAASVLCTMLLVMRCCPTRVEPSPSAENIVTALRNILDIPVETVASIICLVGKSCDRILGETESSFVKNIASKLVESKADDKSSRETPNTVAFLRQLGLATVRQYADEEEDEESESFVAEIAALVGAGPASKTYHATTRPTRTRPSTAADDEYSSFCGEHSDELVTATPGPQPCRKVVEPRAEPQLIGHHHSDDSASSVSSPASQGSPESIDAEAGSYSSRLTSASPCFASSSPPPPPPSCEPGASVAGSPVDEEEVARVSSSGGGRKRRASSPWQAATEEASDDGVLWARKRRRCESRHRTARLFAEVSSRRASGSDAVFGFWDRRGGGEAVC